MQFHLYVRGPFISFTTSSLHTSIQCFVCHFLHSCLHTESRPTTAECLSFKEKAVCSVQEGCQSQLELGTVYTITQRNESVARYIKLMSCSHGVCGSLSSVMATFGCKICLEVDANGGNVELVL